MREAGLRTLGPRHFDVQLIGGMVLHEVQKSSEMKTGEGKTLVRPPSPTWNALAGRGVHIITANYLARRDAEWMGPIYKALGLTVGVIVHDLDDAQRKAAYGADITYGTNNEFGFGRTAGDDRHEVVTSVDCVQRGHQVRHRRRGRFHPDRRGARHLIISGPVEESTDKY